jgi:hypothetical protein
MSIDISKLSDEERAILLEFQKRRFALDFYVCEDSRSRFEQAKENLKKITEPTIAELVRRMSQEWIKDVTPTSCSLNVERAKDIITAENELYELTFKFGDNTVPNETNVIQ